MTTPRCLLTACTVCGLLSVLVSCGRMIRHHHIPEKMNYARVAVDTAAHDDFDDTSADDWQKDPIFEDAEFDGNIDDKQGAMDDYNKFVRGEHMDD